MNDLQDQKDNPYRAPGSHFEPAVAATVTARWHLRSIIAAAVCLVIGVPLAWYWIESIIFSGVVFSVIGVIVVSQNMKHSNTAGLLLGVSAPLLSLSVFALINFNNWSPSKAYLPVNQILTAYGVIALPVAIVAYNHANKIESPTYKNELHNERQIS